MGYFKVGEATFCWYVAFYDDDDNCVADVQLDAFTGEVISSSDPNAKGNG